MFGIPYAKFRDRLAGMAYNRRIAVVAVDPAYTSKWGRRYWYAYLNRTRDHESSSHHAAALVIARRGQRLSARCRAVATRKRESAQPSMGSSTSSAGSKRSVGAIPRSSRSASDDAGDGESDGGFGCRGETSGRVTADTGSGKGLRTVREAPQLSRQATGIY